MFQVLRIIVFSDSHNDFHSPSKVIMAHPGASLFLHLGDGVREWEDLCCAYPEKKILFVRGNCDWGSDAKTEGLVVCEDRKIFFTHGHTYDVKRELGRLIQRAQSMGADIACFGHTHKPMSAYTTGLYLLNPGSIATPRKDPPSYGIIDIMESGIVVSTAILRI